MENMKFFGRGVAGLALILAGVLFTGCDTGSGGYADQPETTPVADTNAPVLATNTLLHKGDQVTVVFGDVVNPIPSVTDTIKEDGSITLIYNQKFTADGKTIGTLQDDIRARYVPAYFRNLTVTVQTQARFYSVGGEVRAPNRQAYVNKMTVLGAIDTAGDYTDFANKHKILVIRADGKKIWVDGVKALTHPELNIEIYPGDRVVVYKRLW